MANELIDKMMFPISVEMKDELGQWATAHESSIAETIRRAIASYTGIEYTQKSGAGAPKKYATVELRKAAQRTREKDKRVLVQKLLAERKAALEAATKAKGIAALKNSLPEGQK